MEPASITLTSKTGFWTQYRATRAVANRLWRTYIVWGFFVGVPLLLVIFMLGTGQPVSTPGVLGLPAWTLPLGGFLFAVAYLPLIQMLSVWSMRRRNLSAGGVQTYTITHEGYMVQGGLFNTTMKWEAFLKAVETREFLLLYISTNWAHFIPKAAATASDLRMIRTILREVLTTRAKLRLD